jgi:hypothetical protein
MNKCMDKIPLSYWSSEDSKTRSREISKAIKHIHPFKCNKDSDWWLVVLKHVQNVGLFFAANIGSM